MLARAISVTARNENLRAFFIASFSFLTVWRATFGSSKLETSLLLNPLIKPPSRRLQSRQRHASRKDRGRSVLVAPARRGPRSRARAVWSGSVPRPARSPRSRWCGRLRRWGRRGGGSIRRGRLQQRRGDPLVLVP